MDHYQLEHGLEVDLLYQHYHRRSICFWSHVFSRNPTQVVVSRAARRLGSVDEGDLAIAAGSSSIQIMKEIRFVATMALRIMVTEPIVIFLALYDGWAYGLLFLYLTESSKFSQSTTAFHMSVHLSPTSTSVSVSWSHFSSCQFRCVLRWVSSNHQAKIV